MDTPKNYEHDCPFEAYITNLGKYNEGELVGEWVKFPTTAEELQKVFDRIGIGSKDEFGNEYEEWFITDYDIYVDGLSDALGEYESLDELNYLASSIDALDEYEFQHFEAALVTSDYSKDAKDIINLIENLDKYDWFPEVEDYSDLGRYYLEESYNREIPEHLLGYFDYEAFGRDAAFNEVGEFTAHGYVRENQSKFIEFYDGERESIPEEYRITNFTTEKEGNRDMDYESFKQEFTEDLKEKLAEHGFENTEMTINEVKKTNQSYEALTVRPEGSNIGINFPIEAAFAEYEHTTDYAGVLAEATLAVSNGLENVPTVDVNELTNYETMKEKLAIEVIATDTNKDLLDKIPHETMEDMSVVYRFILDSNEEGRSSILVTNEMMDRMGVSQDQLKEDALENAPEIRPAVIQGMNEVMMEMMGPEMMEMMGMDELPPEVMYVASVPDRQAGAGVMAYQGFMDEAAEKLGGDFFILPSSLHEVILVPDNEAMRDAGIMDAQALKVMVMEVNANEVRPDEKLTDNVYHYDSKDHVFELAEKFEARQAEKEATADERSEDHGSVLKDLKDKKKEVEKAPAKDVASKAAKAKEETR